ncbi:hypothetical protein WJX84_009535 [Apatococcus fuscideae]|uniref:DNA mismatch repair protein MSH3 n=1 Tax=Apatococcus fuscideae TaxID=2026836 RepID=A0AAW1SWE7_9CHLO
MKSAKKKNVQPSIASFLFSKPKQPANKLPAANPTAAVPRLQHKLVEKEGKRSRKSDVPGEPGKFTPLELQVNELKKRYPDVLLIIEVGYKMRFFGPDAETAAKECKIFAYPDHNYLTASIPVPRLHVYVRRLVQAGHQVGVVRQIETAAIKAAGSNRYAPFERKLTALYTRSTLEAGILDDVGKSEMEAGRSSEGSWSNERLSSYLACVVERPAGGVSTDADVIVGLVVVETSTGDVLYDEFRDGMMRSTLEARLLVAAPAEMLIARPISRHTEKLLGSFSIASSGLRAVTAEARKYKDGGALAAVTGFYASKGSGGDGGTDVEEVSKLPPLVLQALAHALDYLKPFGLETVLRMGANFREFSSAHEMNLSPNALSQLEVLRASEGGGEYGSLLWLLDHTKTAFGGRRLRHWVAHPLTHLPSILDRQDAVEELISSGSAATAGGFGEARVGNRRMTLLAPHPPCPPIPGAVRHILGSLLCLEIYELDAMWVLDAGTAPDCSPPGVCNSAACRGRCGRQAGPPGEHS